MANGFGECVSELIRHFRENGGRADRSELCDVRTGMDTSHQKAKL